MAEQTFVERSTFLNTVLFTHSLVAAVTSFGLLSEDYQNKKTWVRTWYFTSLTCITEYCPTVETKRWLGPQLVKKTE